jgi:hypothetical protein
MIGIYFTTIFLLNLYPGNSLLNFTIFTISYLSAGFIGGMLYWIFLFSICLLSDLYQQREFYLLTMIFKLMFCILIFILVIHYGDNNIDSLSNSMMGSTPLITLFKKVKTVVIKDKADQFKH